MNKRILKKEGPVFAVLLHNFFDFFWFFVKWCWWVF